MSDPQRYEFRQYRGDGTTRDGRTAYLPDRCIYFAAPDLVTAVNTSLAVEQPLLVTGEAGSGKTALADSIAAELELGAVEKFTVRSDQQGRDVLYWIDHLKRFYDAQVRNPKARELGNYIHPGPLGRAFLSPVKRIVLIDEIDKGPPDFANDLLESLDRMELRIPETGQVQRAAHRPVVVVTSNPDSRLPDPFLRRCVFHYIDFPVQKLPEILGQHLQGDDLASFRAHVVDRFLAVRELPGIGKKPATAEMITWARALVRADVGLAALAGPLGSLPCLGTLCKTLEDLRLVRGTGT